MDANKRTTLDFPRVPVTMMRSGIVFKSRSNVNRSKTRYKKNKNNVMISATNEFL
jgi:hypothetical protein